MRIRLEAKWIATDGTNGSLSLNLSEQERYNSELMRIAYAMRDGLRADGIDADIFILNETPVE